VITDSRNYTAAAFEISTPGRDDHDRDARELHATARVVTMRGPRESVGYGGVQLERTPVVRVRQLAAFPGQRELGVAK